MSKPVLTECPNCNDGMLLPYESAELGRMIGVADVTHHTCGERVFLVPGVDYA